MLVDTDAPAVLRVLSDPVRWRIVELLAGEELCVCHLVEELDLAQPLVSHHLRALRDAGIVTAERFRYWTYYRLEPRVLSGAAARLGELASADDAPRTRRPCC